MKVIVTKSKEMMSINAAHILASKIMEYPHLVLGLATGSTPLCTYHELIKMYNNGILDFSRVTTFNLDEYVGLDDSSPYSYRFYMQKEFFDYININQKKINIPYGIAEDLTEETKRYEKAIKKAGGIDVQLLGIGRNGHIGFNEPKSNFETLTHVVELDKQTIEDNARFFDSRQQVPRKAISMGIKTIMNSRKVILLASGENKAEAVKKMIYGKIDPNLQASVLQLHPDVTVILDKEAASQLKYTEENWII